MKIMHQRFGLAKTGRSAKRAKRKSRTLCVDAGEHVGPFFPRAAHRSPARQLGELTLAGYRLSASRNGLADRVQYVLWLADDDVVRGRHQRLAADERRINVKASEA